MIFILSPREFPGKQQVVLRQLGHVSQGSIGTVSKIDFFAFLLGVMDDAR
jgi:hypothetical protein